MDLHEAIEKRHSVRKYVEDLIPESATQDLHKYVDECNRESGLSMQLLINEPKGFAGIFRGAILKNATNYLAIVGKDDDRLAETGGYYGEKVVLKAMQLGISSCWFAMGVKKDAIKIGIGEKMLIVVALGIGASEGKPHLAKPLEKFYTIESGSTPKKWFLNGVKAAALAPTARNQQKFRFILEPDGRVKAESLGGAFSDVDLGIVKYHFEIGAGAGSFEWVRA